MGVVRLEGFVILGGDPFEAVRSYCREFLDGEPDLSGVTFTVDDDGVALAWGEVHAAG